MRGFLASINHSLRSALPFAGGSGRSPRRGGHVVVEGYRPSRQVDVPFISDDDVDWGRLAPLDPPGLRVVPYRPDERWPKGRRMHARLNDPFRAFPQRVPALLDLLHPRDPRD
jgi:hypothetical protein